MNNPAPKSVKERVVFEKISLKELPDDGGTALFSILSLSLIFLQRRRMRWSLRLRPTLSHWRGFEYTTRSHEFSCLAETHFHRDQLSLPLHPPLRCHRERPRRFSVYLSIYRWPLYPATDPWQPVPERKNSLSWLLGKDKTPELAKIVKEAQMLKEKEKEEKEKEKEKEKEEKKRTHVWIVAFDDAGTKQVIFSLSR
jgi:hypothetical protein